MPLLQRKPRVTPCERELVFEASIALPNGRRYMAVIANASSEERVLDVMGKRFPGAAINLRQL